MCVDAIACILFCIWTHHLDNISLATAGFKFKVDMINKERLQYSVMKSQLFWNQWPRFYLRGTAHRLTHVICTLRKCSPYKKKKTIGMEAVTRRQSRTARIVEADRWPPWGRSRIQTDINLKYYSKCTVTRKSIYYYQTHGEGAVVVVIHMYRDMHGNWYV